MSDTETITELTRQLDVARGALEDSQTVATEYSRQGTMHGAAYWATRLEFIEKSTTKALKELSE